MADDPNEEQPTNIALFEHRTIRRIWYKETWYYSVVDVVAALTKSKNPRRYWSDLKRRVASEGYAQVYANCVHLKMPSQDGKEYPLHRKGYTVSGLNNALWAVSNTPSKFRMACSCRHSTGMFPRISWVSL